MKEFQRIDRISEEVRRELDAIITAEGCRARDRKHLLSP